jgi:polar amino acid transport system permease protein
MHVWNFAPVWANADLLALGLLNTLKLTGAALAFGIPLGLVLALMRLSPARLLSWPASAVIEVFRTTPPLVQLFWFFFALPILIHVEMTPYVAAVLTFSIQSAAFFAEVFRGGIVSVERGQWEAARALGMAPRQVMRRVVLPQAVKRMVPAFLERAIELMKTTTLVAIISYADLLFQTN